MAGSVFVRIDSRLLHGQFVTSWMMVKKISRVIIVSDHAAASALAQAMFRQCAPSNVTVAISSVAQATQRLSRLTSEQLRRLQKDGTALLFDTPQGAATLLLALQHNGWDFSQVNIGSLAYQVGKLRLNASVAVDKADVYAFGQLQRAGMKLVYQQVATDKAQDLWQVITAKYPLMTN